MTFKIAGIIFTPQSEAHGPWDSPQGLGLWATAAASSRLRQDSTLRRFMMKLEGAKKS